jgi:hypothetical protein
MLGFLKKIYNRKKSDPPENPAPLTDQADSPASNQKEKGAKTPDLKTAKIKSEEKNAKKNKISEKEKANPARHELIASLARKNGAPSPVADIKMKNPLSDKANPEYAAKKEFAWKKITAAVLAVFVFFGGFYLIIRSGFKKVEEANNRNNEALVSAIRETIVQEVQPLKEIKIKEAEEAAKQEAAKQEADKKINPAELSVKVLNGGAPKGSAEKTKNLLAGQGYARTEAGNVAGPNVALSSISYKEDRLAETAQAISDLLYREDNNYAITRLAATDEEKSADIVVVLGKTKGTSPTPLVESQADMYEIPTADLGIKIVRRGAPVGYAEDIDDLLKNSGYGKSAVDSKKGSDIVQTLVFFNGEKFRLEAEALREFLIQKEQIYSAIGQASSAEEKSADIVIMLGKNKEAPPN